MASSKPTTVSEYLASLPEDRRAGVSAMRELVKKSLPPGFEEGIQYGMISWFVPSSRFAETYNGQPLTIASLAAQKSHDALYLNGVYAVPAEAKRLAEGFAAAGKKLDMGKSCVRWKKLDELAIAPLERALAAVTVEGLIALHDAVHGTKRGASTKAASKKPAPKKPASTKAASKTPASTKPASKKPTPKKAAPNKAGAKTAR
jgi:hypothetical protein